MPRWSPEQLREYETRRVSCGAKPEPAVCHEPVAEKAGEDCNPKRIIVSVKSFRRRLLDTDNLTGGVKYFVDGLRYAAIIPDDRQQDILLQVSQVKVKDKTSERTEIEITNQNQP